MIAVRRADPRDAQAATDVLRRSITELCALDHRGDSDTLGKWLPKKTPQDFLSWLARGGNFFGVAQAHSHVGGVWVFHRRGEKRIFYLAPGPQRTGIGKGNHPGL